MIERLADDLKGYGLAKGTIRFPIGKPPPPALVKKIVKGKLEELRERARSAARANARPRPMFWGRYGFALVATRPIASPS